MKGSDNQEKLVYQIIEDAGNKGEGIKYPVPVSINSLFVFIGAILKEKERDLMVVLCLSRNME